MGLHAYLVCNSTDKLWLRGYGPSFAITLAAESSSALGRVRCILCLDFTASIDLFGAARRVLEAHTSGGELRGDRAPLLG